MHNEKKKIGIISEFRIETVNYGNHLQAYALNYFLSKRYKDNRFETIFFENYKRKITKFFDKMMIKIFFLKIKKIIKSVKIRFFLKKRCEKVIDGEINKRFCKFKEFAKNNIILSPYAMNFNKIKESYYDIYVVGSDVVWAQSNCQISKIKFLDFKTSKEVKKVAYSASFGKDWIPDENKKIVKKCLNDFEYISVRENSSINLLKSIGIDNAIHTLDPTLLLDKSEWKKIEQKPSIINKKPEKYVFLYMLGKDEQQRRNIYEVCKKNNFCVFTVPNADGIYSELNDFENEYIKVNCSPEEWIWLIDHAEYVITDSFHGTVFSTIFKKKFIVLERFYSSNINNRMIDYLKMIKQLDKMIKLDKNVEIDKLSWNYNIINEIIEKEKKNSIDYLDNIFLE